MDIDLKLLQCAVVLSRHHHFGRAAAALGISQPTLSRRIAALEAELGIRIFERSHRDVVATPAGDDILQMADELVTRAGAMSSRLDLMRNGRAGRLRLVAGTFIADIAVNTAIVELIRTNPTIRLELLEADWTSALGLLMTDRIDLAILDVASLRQMPSLRVEPLGKLAGRYVCRAGHPLLAKKTILPPDVRKYPMVHPSVAHEHAASMQDIDTGLMTDAASGSVIPSIAVSSCRLMYEIVAGSDAISVAHPSQVQKEIDSGRLALLDLPWRKRPPAAQFGMVYKRERTLPPAGRLLLNLVRKRMRSLQSRD